MIRIQDKNGYILRQFKLYINQVTQNDLENSNQTLKFDIQTSQVSQTTHLMESNTNTSNKLKIIIIIIIISFLLIAVSKMRKVHRDIHIARSNRSVRNSQESIYSVLSRSRATSKMYESMNSSKNSESQYSKSDKDEINENP